MLPPPSPPSARTAEAEPRRHKLSLVALSLACAYGVAGVLTISNLHRWASHLPITRTSQALVSDLQLIRKHTATLSLEEPGYLIEQGFQSLRPNEEDDLARRWRDGSALRGSPVTHTTASAAATTKTKGGGKDHVASAVTPGNQGGPSKSRSKSYQQVLLQGSARELMQTNGPKALVVGDSLMISLGPALRQVISSELSGGATVMARLGTGLARPDFYDWPAALGSTGYKKKYDYIIMLFGTNDNQTMMDHGEEVPYGSQAWTVLYRQRLEAMMQAACQQSEHALWLGLPPMREASFEHKVQQLNRLARTAAMAYNCVHFVSLTTPLSAENGGFASYLEVGGEDAKVRSDDGIHLTRRGSELVANYVLKVLTATADITAPAPAHRH